MLKSIAWKSTSADEETNIFFNLRYSTHINLQNTVPVNIKHALKCPFMFVYLQSEKLILTSKLDICPLKVSNVETTVTLTFESHMRDIRKPVFCLLSKTILKKDCWKINYWIVKLIQMNRRMHKHTPYHLCDS